MTTRIEGFPNDKMLGEYGGRGFPYLIFIDGEGKKLGEPGARSVEAFRTTQGTIAEVLSLREKVAKGDKKLASQLLIAELKMGMVDFPEAKKRMAELKKLSDADKATLAGLLIDAEVAFEMAKVDSREAMTKFQEKMVAFWKEGKIPTGKAAGDYWQAVMSWADQNKNIKAFEAGVAYMKKQWGSEPRAKSYLETLDKKLAEMKEAGEEPKP